MSEKSMKSCRRKNNASREQEVRLVNTETKACSSLAGAMRSSRRDPRPRGQESLWITHLGGASLSPNWLDFIFHYFNPQLSTGSLFCFLFWNPWKPQPAFPSGCAYQLAPCRTSLGGETNRPAAPALLLSQAVRAAPSRPRSRVDAGHSTRRNPERPETAEALGEWRPGRGRRGEERGQGRQGHLQHVDPSGMTETHFLILQ